MLTSAHRMSYMMFNMMAVRHAAPARRSTVSADDVPSLVRGVRAARGLTQEALAREVGVTFSTVNSWENGRHRPIAALITRLLDIAGAAGLPVAGGPRGPRRAARVRPEPGR
jgi:DNA-binding XRE family transcriptional regulator